MTTTIKATKSGKSMATKMRTITSYQEHKTGFGQTVVEATLDCGHQMDVEFDAETIIINQTKTRCIACGQGW